MFGNDIHFLSVGDKCCRLSCPMCRLSYIGNEIDNGCVKNNRNNDNTKEQNHGNGRKKEDDSFRKEICARDAGFTFNVIK